MVTDNASNHRLRDKLERGAEQLELELQTTHIEKLLDFLSLLKKWNRVYNLTAVRSMDDMVGRHILDSLTVLSWLERSASDNASNIDKSDASAVAPGFDVLDVGTGAGLPVIPLAIVKPELQFLSVESNGKKTRFQQQAVLELGLTNVQVQQARIEDVNATAHTVISRAFTAPEKFLDVVRKNCVERSGVVVMLGVKDKMPSELPAGYTLAELEEVRVPYCESSRHIAFCRRF